MISRLFIRPPHHYPAPNTFPPERVISKVKIPTENEDDEEKDEGLSF